MARFAESTTVSSDASRAEIEKTLIRYGADQFMYGWEAERAVIQFRAQGRHIRFVVDMPDRNNDEFRLTPAKKYERNADEQMKAWEQAVRQRWRALNLVVKAKLEAVEAGISEFDDEFLAHIVLPNGTTAGDWLRPQIDEAYDNGKMPSMLAIGPAKR